MLVNDGYSSLLPVCLQIYSSYQKSKTPWACRKARSSKSYQLHAEYPSSSSLRVFLQMPSTTPRANRHKSERKAPANLKTWRVNLEITEEPGRLRSILDTRARWATKATASLYDLDVSSMQSCGMPAGAHVCLFPRRKLTCGEIYKKGRPTLKVHIADLQSLFDRLLHGNAKEMGISDTALM